MGEDQDCSEPSGKEDEAASKARISVVANHAEGEKEDMTPGYMYHLLRTSKSGQNLASDLALSRSTASSTLGPGVPCT